MDVKNFAGMLIAFVLMVILVATGSPGTLALLDLGLIGLLYVLRHRRPAINLHAEPARRARKPKSVIGQVRQRA